MSERDWAGLPARVRRERPQCRLRPASAGQNVTLLFKSVCVSQFTSSACGCFWPGLVLGPRLPGCPLCRCAGPSGLLGGGDRGSPALGSATGRLGLRNPASRMSAASARSGRGWGGGATSLSSEVAVPALPRLGGLRGGARHPVGGAERGVRRPVQSVNSRPRCPPASFHVLLAPGVTDPAQHRSPTTSCLSWGRGMGLDLQDRLTETRPGLPALGRAEERAGRRRV